MDYLTFYSQGLPFNNIIRFPLSQMTKQKFKELTQLECGRTQILTQVI